jgi:hypothetical protein
MTPVMLFKITDFMACDFIFYSALPTLPKGSSMLDEDNKVHEVHEFNKETWCFR